MNNKNLHKIAKEFEELSATAKPIKTYKYGICPFCEKESISQCRCMRSDSHCAANHDWHYHGNEIHAGQSNHGSKICCKGGIIALVENN